MSNESQSLSGAAQPAPTDSEFEKERAYCLAILDDLIPRIKSIAPPVAAFHVKMGLGVCRDRIATDCAAPVAVPADPRQCPECNGIGEVNVFRNERFGIEKCPNGCKPPAPLPPPQEPCPCPCHKLTHASLEVQEGCLSCSGTGLKPAALAGETRQEAPIYAHQLSEARANYEKEWLEQSELLDYGNWITAKLLTAESRIAQLEDELTREQHDSSEVEDNLRTRAETAEAALTQALAQKSALMEAIGPSVALAKRQIGPSAYVIDCNNLIANLARVYEQVKEEVK